MKTEQCPLNGIPSSVPQTVSGTTVGSVDGFRMVGDSGCGSTSASFGAKAGSGAPDVSYAWRAPSDGEYEIMVEQADFDSAVYALDGGCEGSMLACNDGNASFDSRITLTLERDQDVVIIVDGARPGDRGTYDLTIRPM
jgi:hypothetical protein